MKAVGSIPGLKKKIFFFRKYEESHNAQVLSLRLPLPSLPNSLRNNTRYPGALKCKAFNSVSGNDHKCLHINASFFSL